LELSLKAARDAGYQRIITMLHYPPTNDKMEPSLFTDLIERYEVETLVYGHLHTEKAFQMGFKGCWEQTRVYLTACDFLDFRLLLLEDGGALCKKG
jgi:predicted phosphohydrolase